MLLDRELQYKILTQLSNIFPSYIDFAQIIPDGECEKYLANIYYLELHQLITPKSVIVSKSLGDCQHVLSRGAITQHGLDLLADDGGITAILRTLTVKLETQQFKELLETKIINSDLSTEQKQTLLSDIRELPDEATKHLVTKIIDTGWDNIPALISMITTSIAQI